MACRSENRSEMRGAEAGERVGGYLSRPICARGPPDDALQAGRQSRRRNGCTRMVAGGAINNETAAVSTAHDREPGRARMRAALGATRHVNRQRAVEEESGCAADQRSKRARRNFRRRANRGTRASHDIAARIVGTRDEAEAFRTSGKLWGGIGRETDDEERASWSGAQTACPGAPGGFDQAVERLRIRVPEGKTDAEPEASVRRRMDADGLRCRPRGRSGCFDQQGRSRGPECAYALTLNEFAGARLRTLLRNGLEQPRHDLDRVRRRD